MPVAKHPVGIFYILNCFATKDSIFEIYFLLIVKRALLFPKLETKNMNR